MNRIKLYEFLKRDKSKWIKTLYLLLLTFGVLRGFLLFGINFEYTLVSTVLIVVPLVSYNLVANDYYVDCFLGLIALSLLLLFAQFVLYGIPYEIFNMTEFDNMSPLILFVVFFIDLVSTAFINIINDIKNSNPFQRFFEFKYLFLDSSSYYKNNIRKPFLSEKIIKVLYKEKPETTKNFILNKEIILLLEDDDLVRFSHLSESYKHLEKKGSNYSESKRTLNKLYESLVNEIWERREEEPSIEEHEYENNLYNKTNEETIKMAEELIVKKRKRKNYE